MTRPRHHRSALADARLRHVIGGATATDFTIKIGTISAPPPEPKLPTTSSSHEATHVVQQ